MEINLERRLETQSWIGMATAMRKAKESGVSPEKLLNMLEQAEGET